MRAHTRASKQAADIQRAQEKLEIEVKEREALELELEQTMERIRQSYDIESLELTRYEVSPRKSDITVETVALLWMPRRADTSEPAWEQSVAD
jgi:hypothetical protein